MTQKNTEPKLNLTLKEATLKASLEGRMEMLRKILIYDAAEKSFVGKSWELGAKIFAGHFDRVYPCQNVEDALRAISFCVSIKGPHDRLEVQWWSHGAVGMPIIGNEGMHYQATGLNGVNEIWFRCCDIAKEKQGQRFMLRLGNRGIDVLAHTCVIGTWGMHSGLVGLRSEDDPWWEHDAWQKDSAPWLPRTIPASQMSPPKWAWGKR